ncbi:TetR/AcrR family transcriptional regulator [Gudongella sp. DL1XJH-153]|uniref:TetR/AcrR family transcriptional regulator n=1 Tax=Gudongella sp. DL1XJH-153 TaxID=3409804 RepID=UPI003BB6DCCF
MKRDDIINAAIIEFGENDYNNAKIDSIISSSKTSKGTFYHYFNSKEELYLELARKATEKKIDFLNSKTLFQDKASVSYTIFEILHKQIKTAMDFALEFPEYATLSIRIATETNQEIKGKIRSVVGNISGDYFEKLIAKNIEDGVIREDIPYDVVSGLLSFMLTYYIDFIINLGVEINVVNQEKIYEYLEYYIAFLENGLRK